MSVHISVFVYSNYKSKFNNKTKEIKQNKKIIDLVVRHVLILSEMAGNITNEAQLKLLKIHKFSSLIRKNYIV